MSDSLLQLLVFVPFLLLSHTILGFSNFIPCLLEQFFKENQIAQKKQWENLSLLSSKTKSVILGNDKEIASLPFPPCKSVMDYGTEGWKWIYDNWSMLACIGALILKAKWPWFGGCMHLRMFRQVWICSIWLDLGCEILSLLTCSGGFLHHFGHLRFGRLRWFVVVLIELFFNLVVIIAQVGTLTATCFLHLGVYGKISADLGKEF